MAGKGRVVQVIGPVVDIEFPPDAMPELLHAIKIPMPNGSTLTVEVQQHLGNNWVRCVAMGSTDGLRRGTEAIDTGGP
ncbi:MAG TPA: F0F1 ATP synthase subunit beta, partial [Chloroflexota bacterium]|nr:F0F1 ATP synthase subunit beta [Chloroflexota bacterium]